VLTELLDENEKLREQVAKLVEERDRYRKLYDKLASEVALLRRQIFGQKAERVDASQMELALLPVLEAMGRLQAGDLDAAADAEAALEELKKKAAQKPKGDKKPREPKSIKLEDLEVVRVVVEPPERELPGGELLEKIGEEVSEHVDRRAARLVRVQIVRPKYKTTSTTEGETKIVCAEMPERPIPKSMAGAGLLAHTIVAKYADHIPLHRQEIIYKREGLRVARSTLCDWVLGSSELLALLYQGLKAQVLAAPKIHADDTVVTLVEQGRGKSVQARLWAYLGAGARPDAQGRWVAHQAALLYEFTDDRRGEHVQRMLCDYSGYLQADAYSGFDALYQSGRIVEVGCWAHARRKFVDIVKAAPQGARGLAHEAVEWIGQLYAIEAKLKERTPEERRQEREQHALPLLTGMRSWLEAGLRSVLPKSPTAGAIGYALGHWQALTRYVESGILDIDNNACERAMRPVAIGRRNWLFVGSQRGGNAAATILSLIETCKLHGVEPYAYLADVLQRLPAHPSNRVAELLPFNWKPAG